ncbi:MAG: M55 family metallopeptidase [Desulfobacteraceae bacterium]|nr:M55 family metallopeptidase [Desulfobacteraceae bacterium]
MEIRHKRIMIIADIEGSSACRNYDATRVSGRGWADACLGMTLDVAAVVKALFEAGAEAVYVKDFHRTAHNLFPDYIDSRAEVISGYRAGPVPGLGEMHGATALLMMGMHAPSGSCGFLAHTLTSRISRLEVNGRLMCEAELFAASVAGQGVAPLFFSGCPVACRYAKGEMPWLNCHSIDKFAPGFDAPAWRNRLASRAVESLGNGDARVFNPRGPFEAVVTMRDGRGAAAKLAKRWGFDQKENRIYLRAGDMEALYLDLIRLCYFTPLTARVLPLALPLYNLYGRAALAWVRSRRG